MKKSIKALLISISVCFAIAIASPSLQAQPYELDTFNCIGGSTYDVCWTDCSSCSCCVSCQTTCGGGGNGGPIPI